MRKIIVNTFVTLDGIMQAPGGPEEDREGGFAHGGWIVPYFDAGVGDFMAGVFKAPFDLLMGRKTYDIFASHWPRVANDPPKGADDGDIQLARTFDAATKYVATHRPETLDWKGSEGLGDDVVARLRAIKADDGPDLIVPGSSQLIQTLLGADLVDQFKLVTAPLTLGQGKRLFAAGTIPAAFKVDSAQTTESGVTCTVLSRDGEVRTGDFSIQS